MVFFDEMILNLSIQTIIKYNVFPYRMILEILYI